MSRNLISSSLIGSVLFLGTALAADQAATMTFQSIDISTYLPGVVATVAVGINPQGAIVGRYVDATGTHGYLLSGGIFTTIDVGGQSASLGCPSTKFTTLEGINPEGDIVGYCVDPATNRAHGFLRYPGGTFIPIDFPASLAPPSAISPDNTIPIRISPTGFVVGCFHHLSSDTGVTMHGFVYRDGKYDFLSMEGTMNNGITPDGRTIVGFGMGHAYIVQDGVYQLLDLPGSLLAQAGATFSYGSDINPSGEIVGYFANPSGTHGFLLNKDGLSQINYPGVGVIQTLVNGINPLGDLVGVYTDARGNHGFLARSSH